MLAHRHRETVLAASTSPCDARTGEPGGSRTDESMSQGRTCSNEMSPAAASMWLGSEVLGVRAHISLKVDSGCWRHCCRRVHKPFGTQRSRPPRSRNSDWPMIERVAYMKLPNLAMVFGRAPLRVEL